MNIEGFQEPFRGAQQRRRIMVARDDNDVSDRGFSHFGQEMEVKLLRGSGRRTGIEHVPGYDDRIDSLFCGQVHEPEQKLPQLLVPPLREKPPPQMPIRCVKKFHLFLCLIFFGESFIF